MKILPRIQNSTEYAKNLTKLIKEADNNKIILKYFNTSMDFGKFQKLLNENTR